MVAPPAPDSPRSSQSPPPDGVQGDLEMELFGLANALYNLGTTVINDSTKERDKPGGGVKQVGLRVNDVIKHLEQLDMMSDHITTRIPFDVLKHVDEAHNPEFITRERIERVAAENQFAYAKIAALDRYRSELNEALAKSFPGIEAELELPMPGDAYVKKEEAPATNGIALNGSSRA
ncbi:uncharacterized protein SCHCODRAFT_02521960 [Schizophyllum commune H4-8]|uniref:Mediator of RNA polymerase II transcription subunit 10 n=1 Tax=Schizophyllum commune (strain H4-8 / FGSC 9210) TaxID=578458 RepID=D8QLJ6_SCHCM|nr:uncharacterized protein SCHCODRAFT_02521960 [Schizophyllum commune H4-8]KAI5884934.1 hypothetical protein SCHCODRAFT_02521960 [Schizophyllum commune H4-8]